MEGWNPSSQSLKKMPHRALFLPRSTHTGKYPEQQRKEKKNPVIQFLTNTFNFISMNIHL